MTYVNNSGRNWDLITRRINILMGKKMLWNTFTDKRWSWAIFSWSVGNAETWAQHWFEIVLLSSALVLICSAPLCSGVIINELMDLTANIGKSSSRFALCIAVINIFYCFSYPNLSCLNAILIKQIQNGLIQQLEGLHLSLFSNTTQVSALSLKNSSELVNQRIIKIL